MKQLKIDRNKGMDRHVRTYQLNNFARQNSQTYQMVGGEISLLQPEPLFTQNFVNVKLAKGGDITTVAYPGAFIDPITGNLHGTYEGPIPGQMVMVGFENGNSHAPFVVQRYPYQGSGNSFAEAQYITPLTKKLRDSTDVTIGHFSGSYLTFNTGILSGNLPGSVNLYSMTGFTSECLLGTTITQDLGISLSDIAGNKIEISSTGILIQDSTGLNKIEVGPAGVSFTASGVTIGALTHIHPTGVGPSAPPTPGS